jgi:DNA repair protein RadC
MCDLTTEECHAMLLNNANKVIDCVKVGSGGYTATTVDIRCVMREALLKRATAMILCHNHPSGSAEPSRQDLELTERVASAAALLDIRLLDHVIISRGAHYSFRGHDKIR